jgi:hypothetical protein
MKKLILFLIGVFVAGVGFYGANHFFPLNLIPTFIGCYCAFFFAGDAFDYLQKWVRK